LRVLYVYRHAKSSRADLTLQDHARPLNDRGRRESALMAEHAKQIGLSVDLVWSSSSLRARQTLEPMLPVLAKSKIGYEDWLYSADTDDIIEHLRAVPAGVGSVMLVGHNPTLQELVLELAVEGKALARVGEKLATGSLAMLELPIDDWADVRRHAANLSHYIEPKQLT